MRSLSNLEEEGKLAELIAVKDNLRFFFIIMLWDKLYLHKENNLHLLKFLNLVNHLAKWKSNFTNWCDEIPSEFLKMQVHQLLTILDHEFIKLKPGVIPQELIGKVNLNIENICSFLEILY